jgi:hypothetical protein
MEEKKCIDSRKHSSAKGMTTVPFASLEILRCIYEKQNKRLRVVLSVVVAMLLASNIAWIIYAL